MIKATKDPVTAPLLKFYIIHKLITVITTTAKYLKVMENNLLDPICKLINQHYAFSYNLFAMKYFYGHILFKTKMYTFLWNFAQCLTIRYKRQWMTEYFFLYEYLTLTEGIENILTVPLLGHHYKSRVNASTPLQNIFCLTNLFFSTLD